ncbi:MAG: peptidylprolyl isomerase [Nitrospiria bacterium]
MLSKPDPPLAPPQRTGLLKIFVPFFLVFLNVIPAYAIPVVIDQILATVDDHLITQSDLHFQTLFSLEFPLLEEKDKDPHLEFAIDQVLFLEDAGKFGIEKPSDEEIKAKLSEIQKGIGTEEQFKELLTKEGLTMDDVKELITRYFLSKQFIDQRINFFVFVSDNEIESYYKDHLADWNGAPMGDVRSQINTILSEQKRKIKLEDFLVKRRAKAKIRVNPPYP